MALGVPSPSSSGCEKEMESQDGERPACGQAEDTDFMSDWPEWKEEKGLGSFIMYISVAGFLFGPVLSPGIFGCVMMNQLMKARHSSFDVYVMSLVLILLAAMFFMFLNTIYVFLLPSHGHLPPKIDRYGPLLSYVIVYTWLASVLLRHFRSLSTDSYNAYPTKLEKLSGVQFNPPLTRKIQLAHDRPIRNVIQLLRTICLYKDIFVSDEISETSSSNDEAGDDSPLCTGTVMSLPVSDLLTTPMFSAFDTARLDDDVEEEGESATFGTNWGMSLMLGFVCATVQTVIIRVFFSHYYIHQGYNSSMVYWLSTLYWGSMFTLFWSILFSLMTLYARQYESLKKFTMMTNCYDADRHGLFHLDISSTVNLRLWHEARVYMVDQVMQPTSFLRAVFDPTCGLMAFILVASVVVLIVKHLLLRQQRIDEFSAGLASLLLMSAFFFSVVISLTRWVQRALRKHEGLLFTEKRQVMQAILSHTLDGLKTLDLTPEELEAHGWKPHGHSLLHLTEPEYITPLEPIRQPGGATSYVHKAMFDGRDTLLHFSELLRRLRLLEAMCLHVSQSAVRPRLLELSLTSILNIVLSSLLAFQTVLFFGLS